MTENERLTFKTDLGISIDKNEDCPTCSICWNCNIKVKDCKYFNDAVEKLAKYEAIGTIEEFKDLKEQNTELHCEFQSINATMDLFEQEIRAKVIDEFAERLHSKITAEIDDCADELEWIEEIAEQLNAGGKNEVD